MKTSSKLKLTLYSIGSAALGMLISPTGVAQSPTNSDALVGIPSVTAQAMDDSNSNSIVATNFPSQSDQSISGISVGALAPYQAQTNAPILATNLPSTDDQPLSASSVLPALSTNPPMPPQGLDAGTNALTNLPIITPPDLPIAAPITNAITPSSLPAPLPETTTGPFPMPTPTTNNFGLIDKIMSQIKDVPLTAEALAKAGNKVVPGIIAKDAKRMNIDETVQYALSHNPDILTAVQNIQRASGNYINVRAGLLPKLNVLPAYTWLDPNIQNGQKAPGASSTGIPSVQVNQAWNINFQGTQLLYDGWKTPSLTDAAKLSEQIAYFQLRQTLDRVVADVVRQFYQVVLNRALVIANEQQVSLYKTQVTDQQSRYDAGTVPRFNVLQAQVQMANAMPPLIAAENNLRVSMFRLVQLIGMDYPNIQNIKLPFDVQGELGYYPRKIDENASIHTALQRNPQLKAQRSNILVTAKQVTAAISGWLPTLNANGGYQIQSYKYDQSLSETIEGWFFGATGSWAIFDGLATYGSVKQAKATMQNAKIAYDNNVRGVVTEVQTAISNLQQARETIESQKATVEQAAEALRLSRERLDAGAGVQLDVINAQVQLLQAQTAVLSALFQYIAATAEYDRALSLHTQYEELFDDPLNKWEKARYQSLNAENRTRPQLPRSMRKNDPLPPGVQFDDLIKSSTVRKQEQPLDAKDKGKTAKGTKKTDKKSVD
jgi:outer membrane protein TolC